MRRNGILMPISALPSNYGIGCFSKEAYDFVDILKKAGQTLWQILPLGPTGYGDSPYQSFSTFAGNPYFIDLEQLIDEGFLRPEECQCAGTAPSEPIDYENLYHTRFTILRKAYQRSQCCEDPQYRTFCTAEAEWLDDYALFMAIKQQNRGKSWEAWDPALRFRQEQSLQTCRQELADDIEYYKYLQYLFRTQWQRLKTYANENGIEIIGDIPIYVAMDSADTWSHPELFQFNANHQPIAVAGCPPDGFSATGQLWGNPLYDWPVHKKHHYKWWLHRIAHCFRLYDIIRIDHFRGFDEYYSIPYGQTTAEHGTWQKGPGMSLFHALNKHLDSPRIIAEDLGFLTESVTTLLKESGYPGMKVLQFAFDSREDSDYLPHNYGPNCVVYTGTHDNDTLKGWFRTLTGQDRRLALLYTNSQGRKPSAIHWTLITLAMSSVAETCIIPAQDYLEISSEGRINTPSTLGENWKWRMPEGAFTEDLINRIAGLTRIYGRSI